jgi:hypothetical protein
MVLRKIVSAAALAKVVAAVNTAQRRRPAAGLVEAARLETTRGDSPAP